MNKAHEDYLSMARVSHNVLLKYESEWKNVARFVREVAGLTDKIEETNRVAR